jgi:aspartokinase
MENPELDRIATEAADRIWEDRPLLRRGAAFIVIRKALDLAAVQPTRPSDCEDGTEYQEKIVEAAESMNSQARVTLVGVPDTPGFAAQVFGEIAEAGISVDMIVQSMGRDGHANLSFTVPQTDLERSLKLAAGLLEEN